MKHSLISAFAVCMAMSAALGEMRVGDTEPSLMMPDNASFAFADDGNFLVDGEPRFLIGNLYYCHYGTNEMKKGSGYGKEHAWIYEGMPDRAYLQRLGFDTSGGEVSSTWLGTYRNPRKYYPARNCVEWAVASNYWHSGLPMVVDLTCATWSHGGMKYVKGSKPDESAFVDDCHFIYYSLVTQEGRDLWREFWRSGAEELKAHGAKPYVYELFNEPSYHDKSPAARKAFASFLSQIWKGDANAMDGAWRTSYCSFEAAAAFKSPEESAGLSVAWHKFREKVFQSGIKLGIKTIREVDPSARFCFQPMSHLHNVVATVEAYNLCEVSMMPTGGGSLYTDTIIRALSDGKPMIDGETYLRRTRTSHRAKLLLEWARCLNASYYFKWERRLKEAGKKNQDEGLKRLGEKYPWLGLNPAFVAPEELVGIMNAKRDIFAMQDLFAPRMRGICEAQRVALLFSMPTHRLPSTPLRKCASFGETCFNALAVDAHLPVDAVFEEQLDTDRLGRYQILVAAGVDAVYEDTPAKLAQWVRHGGTLILAHEALGHDEWGNVRGVSSENFPGITLGERIEGGAKRFSFSGAEYEAVAYRQCNFARGAGWETLCAFPDGHAAVARRKFGKGEIYYIGARFPKRGDEGRLIASISSKLGVVPTCSTLDWATGAPVDGIEVHAARLPNGDTGFFAMNTTLAPIALRFIPGKGFASHTLLDVSTRTILGRDADGAAILALRPDDPVVLRGAASAQRIAKSLEGAPKAWNAKGEGFSCGSYERDFAQIPSFLASSGVASTKTFPADPSRISHVDLRDVANVRLGGMLADPPWGTQNCAGVPFNLIRHDQNKGCSALAMPGRNGNPATVSVNLRSGALYFLHAGEGVKPGNAIVYTIRYSDGTAHEYEAQVHRDFGDVAIALPSPLPESLECSPGWLDRRRRGLWVSKWVNPYPEKALSAIEISAKGDFTAVVAAISSESSTLECSAASYDTKPKFRPWSGVKAGYSEVTGDIRIDFGESVNWSGLNVDWKGAPAIPEAPAADLEFFLVTDGEPPDELQLRIGGGRFHVLAAYMRRIGCGRWRVAVPIEYAKDRRIDSIGIQRRGNGKPGCAKVITLKDLRITWRMERDNPLELRRFAPTATEEARPVWRDGGLEIAVADNNKHWAAMHMWLDEPMDVKASSGLSNLVFEVNSGRTPLGVFGTGRQRLRVEAIFKTGAGKELRVKMSDKTKTESGAIDDDPWTWQTVRIPFSAQIPPEAAVLSRFVMKLLDMPQDCRSGIVFRNFRFEAESN